MNSQIIFYCDTIHPQTSTDLILHGNSNVKDVLDNFRAVPMSDFGYKLAHSQSLAEFCRLIHHNYRLANDLTDGILWSIVGKPVVCHDLLHSSLNNYIYRTLKLCSSNTFVFDFFLQCSDLNRIFFQIHDNTTASNGAKRIHYRFLLDSDSHLILQHCIQTARGYYPYAGASKAYDWGNSPVIQFEHSFNLTLDSLQHLFIKFDSDDTVGVKFDGGSYSWSPAVFNVPNKSWYIYLGYSAEAFFNYFSVSSNNVVVSSLIFA